LDVHSAKQDSKMIKVLGKRKVVQSRQDAQIAKANAKRSKAEQDAAEDPTSSTASDQIPDDSAAGSDYMANTDQETVDVESQDVTDQDQGQDQDQDDGSMSGGFIDLISKAGKAIVKKIATSPQVQNTKLGKVATSVKSTAVANQQVKTLTTKNLSLQSELDKAKKEQLLYGGGGLAVGILLGVVIGKSFKR